MKRYRYFAFLKILLLHVFPGLLNAQNLCPNPGFEQLSGCPTGAGELNLAPPWSSAGAPSDLFSSCHVNGAVPGCGDVSVPLNFAGSSGAYAGSNYAGFYTRSSVTNERTYLRVPLVSPLTSGQLYRVSAWFKRSSLSGYASNRIGMVLSTSALLQTGNGVISISPQFEFPGVLTDTSSWSSFTGYYEAAGGEAHLSVGSFRNDASTTSINILSPAPACSKMQSSAFYYADNFSVTAVTEQLNVTGDTAICAGESTVLTGITNTAGWWSLASLPYDTIPSVNNSITVNPTSSTTWLWNGFQNTYAVTVSVVPAPVISLINDTTICEGSTVTLDAGNPGASYLWSDGSITSSVNITEQGLYIVTVNNGSCLVSDSTQVNVLDVPDPGLPATAVICPDNGESITLSAGTGASYLWLPDGDTTSSVNVSQAGTYSVTVTHTNGCIRTDSTIVTEVCRETLFIPGAFTPNQDGKNDLFYADGTGIESFTMTIFSRWGQVIFETGKLGISGAWDGTFEGQEAAAGTYAYKVQYDAIQTSGRKKRFVRSGSFNLVR